MGAGTAQEGKEESVDGTAFLRSLRAVRRFRDEPIPDEVLRDILEVARWTGSSKNTQPWELVVVRDRAMLRDLSQLGQYAGHLAGAQIGVALVMEAGAVFDAGRLAQNIMLASWAHGVGSCIASLYPEENHCRAREMLDVPAPRRVDTVISLGYPADASARRLSSGPPEVRAAVPVGRTALSDLVNWERYGRRAP